MNRQDDDRDLNPEWLAAHADGELDREEALAPFKKKVEDWLAGHPEARPEVEKQQRVVELWQQTAPPQPDAQTWNGLQARVIAAARKYPRRGRRLGGWIAALAGLAAAAVWLIITLVPAHQANPVKENPTGQQETPAPFAVASSDEIEILSVEGEDTGSLAVGEMPVRGPLELLAPGEVIVTSVQPAIRDNMRPDVHEGPASPMIWALLDSER